MTSRSRGIIIGLGGFFAGGFAASVIDLSVWSRAGLVAGVCLAVSLTLLVLLPKARK